MGGLGLQLAHLVLLPIADHLYCLHWPLYGSCIAVDAFDQTMDYSTQIFSLGVLLSSLLVFNQV